MASKLHKAQDQLEQLLRDLGQKAQMLGLFDQGDPARVAAYQEAEQANADRQTELDFILAEISEEERDREERKRALQVEISQMKVSKDKLNITKSVKRGKVGGLEKKLAGLEYDFKFEQRELADELHKQKKQQERENPDRVKYHTSNIKRMKLKMLKQTKEMESLRRQIDKFEQPAQELEQQKSSTKERIHDLRDELARLGKEGSTKENPSVLEQQKVGKDKEVRRSGLHQLSCLADVAESLYDRRLDHPVLRKYYRDIERVVELIDDLQEPFS